MDTPKGASRSNRALGSPTYYVVVCDVATVGAQVSVVRSNGVHICDRHQTSVLDAGLIQSRAHFGCTDRKQVERPQLLDAQLSMQTTIQYYKLYSTWKQSI
eukprot:scaffold1537_cov108-Cylindrotheca_fusiformis.AAC.2